MNVRAFGGIVVSVFVTEVENGGQHLPHVPLLRGIHPDSVHRFLNLGEFFAIILSRQCSDATLAEKAESIAVSAKAESLLHVTGGT